MKKLSILAICLFSLHTIAQTPRRLKVIDPVGVVVRYYQDLDGDTFGNPNVFSNSTTPIFGYVLNKLDCNDANSNITLGTVWYVDMDNDGLGDPSFSLTACLQPSGYVSNNLDQCPTQSSATNDCASNVVGFTEQENYLHTTVYKQAFSNGEEENAEDHQKLEQITYFDGLGRPIQQVAIRQSSAGKDIVTHIAYDALGRQAQHFLPYASENEGGAYQAAALAKTNAYYNTAAYQYTTNPYSETFFEASPLNIPIEVAAPGNDWKEGIANEHTVKNEYQLVQNTDAVYNLQVSFTNGVPSITNKGLYEIEGQTQGVYKAPTLYKFITKNENWKPADQKDNTTEIYKDYRGRVLLKRSFNNNIPHNTYTVYDAYGNISFVIPPKVTLSNSTNNAVSSTELSELCYQYQYDAKNRLVAKKIPGKGWEFIVYDKLERPILTQDAVQRAKATKEWLFTKYDLFGRVVYTGIYKDNRSREALQISAAAHTNTYEQKGTVFLRHTNNAYPTNIALNDIYTVQYYDDYLFDQAGLSIPTTVYGTPTTTQTKTLATGSKERILIAGSDYWVTSIVGYDKKGRAIFTASNNSYLNTTDTSQSALDFVGNLTKSTTTHTSNTTISITNKYTYDHLNRLVTQRQKINNQPEEYIVVNTYDALGVLASKNVGNTEATPLQTVDFKYNIRGWLTGINNVDALGTNLFAFQINYTSKDIAATAGYTSLYNGNIAETIWKTQSDSKKRGYQYKYDALSRITGANYRAQDNLLSGNGKYQTAYAYDANGNLTALSRNGSTTSPIDALQYEYASTSNKLVALVDGSANFTEGVQAATTNYAYEPNNGNLTQDSGKGILNIEYNYLNLPTKVDFGSGKKIEYIYTATGSKLQKKVTDNGITTTNYANGFLYENEVLKHFGQPEGYVAVTGSFFEYVYQYKDHLGNIRLNYANNGSRTAPNLQIKEENAYYPFGMKMGGFNNVIVGAQDDFKYNGKEYQDETINGKKLNWYDYGARNYDPTIGRWHVLDALAEKVPDLTPFRYGFNNPINVIDPDGNFEQDDFSGSLQVYGGQGGERFSWGVSEGNTTTNENIGITSKVDENGNKPIQINITGKIINFSDNDVDMEKALSDITSYIEKTFSGEFEGTTVKTIVNFSIANSMNDVAESDHLIVLAEPGKNNSNTYGAAIDFGGKVSLIDADYFTGLYDTFIGNQGERSTTHEMGHQMNLKHPSGGIMQSGTSNNDFTLSQLNSVIRSYNSGILNRGMNYNVWGLPNSGRLEGRGLFTLKNTQGRNKKVNRTEYFKKLKNK